MQQANTSRVFDFRRQRWTRDGLLYRPARRRLPNINTTRLYRCRCGGRCGVLAWKFDPLQWRFVAAITRTALGGNQAKAATLLNVSVSSISAGDMIIVLTACDVYVPVAAYSYDGTNWEANASIDATAGSEGSVVCQIFSHVALHNSSGSAKVEVSSFASSSVAMAALKVVGLASSPKDKSSTGQGTSADASSGTSGALSQADEIVICAAGWEGPGTDSTNSWSGSTPNDIVAGQSVGTTGSGDTSNVKIDEGYKIVSSASACTGISHNSTSSKRDWAAAIVTYKAAATTARKTWDDLAYASWKTVMDLATASVKTVDDLA